MKLAACARREWPWLPRSLPATALVVVGPTGETLRLEADGTATRVLPGGHPRPGRAADPCAGRAAP